ncbi:dye-decolorizing heme-containing peroxidase [Aspergillus melleus]|uniref:Dye-decolorizing heme-containing peroxidase n=1 Tax=Aspergillus melleus TaxID=138277 RepID=A0ACC3ATF3_9EURO|nr:dye-decolorizing heme-containing peroxidase [Aspergillus melleus]
MSSTESEKPKIDTTNIQGDIWPGLPKRYEELFFFTIKDEPKFRNHLAAFIPEITTAEQAVQDKGKIRQHKIEITKGNKGPELLNLSGVNISFTSSGIGKLGKHDLKAGNFENGMLADLRSGGPGGEGRDNPEDWEERFRNPNPKKPIDGVILVTGETRASVYTKLHRVVHHFVGILPWNSSIEGLFTVEGNVRDGENKGKEHFGFEDGVSQPQLDGLDDDVKQGEPALVPPGIIINGEPGYRTKQPDWATDGSFFVFRKLQQYVPEFQKWVDDTAPEHKLNSDQLGARLMGRWKSGAPVCMTPWNDDPSLAKANNYDYTPLDKQDKCPFAAHTRKCNPRADLSHPERFVIMRRGISYGGEVTHREWKDHKTSVDRGLLFMCYQSNIANGFRMQQARWCNMDTFPPDKDQETGDPGPGVDAICGQPNPPDTFDVSLCDGDSKNCRINLKVCVVPRGGEYFFTPSIKALQSLTKK